MATFAPMFALHTDAEKRVLTASSFDYSYKLNDWLRSLDIQPGDTIKFEACLARNDDTEAPAPLTDASLSVAAA